MHCISDSVLGVCVCVCACACVCVCVCVLSIFVYILGGWEGGRNWVVIVTGSAFIQKPYVRRCEREGYK